MSSIFSTPKKLTSREIPTSNSTALLVIGKVVGLFGLRGELKCDPTSAGRTLFSKGATLVARHGTDDVPACIATVREHADRLLVSFEGFATLEDASRLIGATLLAARERLEAGLERGEYLDVDLVGASVESTDGKPLGTVLRVQHYPASDMLVLASGMIPLVQAFVRSIDLLQRRVIVDIPPGLLDEDFEEG